MAYFKIERSMLRYGHKFGLTLDAIYLYARLRDRATLSAKNGLADASGNVYVYCSRESAAQMVGCSVRKASTLFGQLKAAGILTEDADRRVFLRLWTEPSCIYPVHKLRNGGFWPITFDNVYAIPDDYVEVHDDVAGAPISNRAKVLYALLHNKSGQQELYGNDTCSLPRALAMEMLSCGHDTLARVYRELESLGLIARGIRQGFGGNRSVAVRPSGPIFARQWSDFCTPVVRKTTHQSSEICTQTNLSNPSLKNHPSSASLGAAAPEAPGSEIDFDVLEMDLKSMGCADVDAQEATEAIQAQYTGDLASPARTYYIGHDRVTGGALVSAYRSIDRYVLATLAQKLIDNWTRIKDKPRYIRAALYRADKHAGEAYFTKLRLVG